MRRLAEKIHLWLGVITAPLVFFVCITGTIIVFSDEIMDLAAGKARYVAEIKTTKLPTEELLQIMHENYPERRVPSYMVTYRNPERSVRFNSYDPEKGLRMVYVDPYSGEILKDDGTIYFFYITAHLHNSLLWHGTGEWIIDITTILFLLASITGLIMWWPKNKSRKAMRYAFSLKWKQSFGKLNIDMHRVIGMYMSVLLIVLSLTGLMIAFKPLFNLTKDTFGGNSVVEWNQDLAVHDGAKKSFPVNSVIDRVFKENPGKDEIQIYTFKNKEWGYYALNAAKHIGLKSAMNNRFLVYDRYSGEKIDIQEEALQNEVVENMVWTLHMGNWMGLGGKTLTFLAGLFASFLPISGLYIWIPKLQRKRKRRKQLGLI